MDKLTAVDLQDIALAEHAETYVEQEQRAQVQGRGQRSKTNSKRYRDYQQQMEDKYGGLNG